MKAVLLKVSGHWAHFKKPETNNNPLTHDFITKTAMIGLMGAVMGIEREQMRPLFPILSDALVYGVALDHPVVKQSWAFTLRRFTSDVKTALVHGIPAPKAFELLREPSFTVVLAQKSESIHDEFEQFIALLERGETHYDPVLGLHNCPANVEIITRAVGTTASGNFKTRGFIDRSLRPSVTPEVGVRYGFERLPTFQDSEMWNPPDRYKEVIYADGRSQGESALISGEGNHYVVKFDQGGEEAWCLI